MNNETSRPVATRVSLEEFAKVLDSLIEKGVPSEHLMANSNIVKTVMRLAIANSANPTEPANQESLDTIRQLWRINKRSKNIDLES